MSAFNVGDRVKVMDPGLAELRGIMRNATGREPRPNHHGTVSGFLDNGDVLIDFDDGVGAPYPESDTRHLPPEQEVAPKCDEHREVQHRDGKPPWCRSCGWHHGRPATAPMKIKET